MSLREILKRIERDRNDHLRSSLLTGSGRGGSSPQPTRGARGLRRKPRNFIGSPPKAMWAVAGKRRGRGSGSLARGHYLNDVAGMVLAVAALFFLVRFFGGW